MFIFFDLDGTLLDHHDAQQEAVTSIYIQYASLTDLPEPEFFIIWNNAEEEVFGDYLSGKVSFEEQRRIRLRRVLTKSPQLENEALDEIFSVYLSAYEQSWRMYADVLPTLQSLKEARYQLGIISNGQTGQQRAKLSNLKLTEFFGPVVISEEAGFSKPDSRIFALAAKLANMNPQQCIYIGDRLETDALGSQAAEMKGVWLDRDGIGEESKEVTRITSLNQLPEVIERITNRVN